MQKDMDSDFQQQQYQHHFQDLQKQFNHQKQQLNTLTRLRSAPSSYFATFGDTPDDNNTAASSTSGGDRGGEMPNVRGDFSSARPLSPETEGIFARFVSRMEGGGSFTTHKLSKIPEASLMHGESGIRVKEEDDHTLHQHGNYSNTHAQMMYQSALKPPLANYQGSGSSVSSSQIKIGNQGSGLTRHSSSPAGFFDNLNIDGYGVMRGMGEYGGGSASNEHVNYATGQPSSSSGLVRQSSEVEAKIMRMNSLDETKFNINRQSNDSNYNTGHPMTSWEDSILSETFPSLDGGDESRKLFSEQNSSENQTRSRPTMLAHHLSLPNTSTEHFADGVPLRMRAKRGCATHPRSIAERVRRTKISEKMRKLQDLVPNMDKQTNTTDMLDLAVDYIKDLQKQVKNLHENQAKCTCSR